MLEVYDGVPLPEIDRRPKAGRRKWPLETMQVGQMCFEPGSVAKSVSAYVSRISKTMPGKKFTARHCYVVFENQKPIEVEAGHDGAIEGTGVWRIE